MKHERSHTSMSIGKRQRLCVRPVVFAYVVEAYTSKAHVVLHFLNVMEGKRSRTFVGIGKPDRFGVRTVGQLVFRLLTTY